MLRLSKFCVVVIVLITGCTKTTTKREYVARVGDAVLTEQDIAAIEGDSVGQLRRQYISSWISNELLYQEAERKGLDKSDDVLRALAETKKQLTVNAYLEQEVYAGVATGISDNDILDEFNRNREAYRLTEDVVSMSYAIFGDRDAANSFRATVIRGASWDDALRRVESDNDAKSQLIRSASNGYFTQAMLFPEELWKMARTLSKGDVSYVVRTNAGYVVALIHGGKKQGEVPDLDFAKNEVRQRLMIQRRVRRYEELLSSLRSKSSIDVRLGAEDSLAQTRE